MTRADTIARHLNQAGEHLKNSIHAPRRPTTGGIDAAMRCINLAFLETLGGAAVAGEAAGKTPEPPKPAGWVVRLAGGWRQAPYYGTRGFWARIKDAGPFPTEEMARKSLGAADGDAAILPVDAAGNVIEALPGVAWEAARAGEEAERLRTELATTQGIMRTAQASSREWQAALRQVSTQSDQTQHRLRTELAAVKAERDEAMAERDRVLANAAALDASLRRLRADRDAFQAEAERLRTELATVKAERDALNAAEADLRHALRQIAELVGGAVSLGASTDMHCAVADEVRVVVADLRAERDALAAEVRRSREQKPVHLALVDKQGAVVDGYLIKTRALAEDDARRRACTVAPLYLAPVVRDHSGVIAQCEEALKEWDRDDVRCRAGALMAIATTAALAALKGETK